LAAAAPDVAAAVEPEAVDVRPQAPALVAGVAVVAAEAEERV
jgi:hypothetical protein